MPRRIIAAFAARLREHALTAGISTASIIFHGGEPLLAGQPFFVDFVRTVREELPENVRAFFGLQTNGTLLTESWAELLCELGIKIGISLDGPAEVNDLHRLDHRNRSSQERVEDAVRLMLASDFRRKNFTGVLSVIDPETDPIKVFEYFCRLGVKSVDFLLPDVTYDKAPRTYASDTPHGNWLVTLFNRWVEQEDELFRVPFFETIIELLLGRDRSVDYIGGRPTRIAVIETDGGIEPVDVLKICGSGFTKLDLNVVSTPLESVRHHWLGAAYAAGNANLCATCHACSVVDVCGGGYMPHRYSADRGFDNPSVYCNDLKLLIDCIDQRLGASVPGYKKIRLRNQQAMHGIINALRIP
jgi:uncharacterized protein